MPPHILKLCRKNKDQAWWCLTDAAGEMTTVGVADIELHGVGNFVLMLLLYRPLRRALQMAKKQLRV